MYWCINSLSPGRCGNDFKSAISEHMLRIHFMSTCEIAVRWMPQDTFDDKSTLVYVMAWCRQAPSHYLSQCSPMTFAAMSLVGHNELGGRVVMGLCIATGGESLP